MGNGTSIGRVRGLGSAHDGAHHWLTHRLTAISNLILMSWFIVSLLLLGDYSYASVTAWLSQPVSAVAMMLLAASLFWHAQTGLTVLIDYYILISGTKFGILTLLIFGAVGGGVFAIFSVATLAFGA